MSDTGWNARAFRPTLEKETDMAPIDVELKINDDNPATSLETADQASADGMFELYVQYTEVGDETEAQKWLRKAAAQGHCRALAVLGAFFIDEDERLSHEMRAAELGCDQAQVNLGLWYLHYQVNYYEPEEYMPKDYAQAVFWLTKAANMGNMDAQLKLGQMYLEGQGVPQDDDIAFVWIRKSAEQEHEWANYDLGMMYLEGRGVSQNDEEAAACFMKGARLGDLDATYQLGVMYLEGRGIGQDDGEACFWIRKAAKLGYSDAQALLGEMLELGHATPRNPEEAAEWLSKAAYEGDEDAQVRLDRLLCSGALDRGTRDTLALLGRDPVLRRILH